jgi:hypothetical protein
MPSSKLSERPFRLDQFRYSFHGHGEEVSVKMDTRLGRWVVQVIKGGWGAFAGAIGVVVGEW